MARTQNGVEDPSEIVADTDVNARTTVIGIGGSAGALPALMRLLTALGGDVPAAIVVVLHLAPDHESHVAEILQRVTPLRVSQVRNRTLLEPGHVYVIAPGTNLVTDDGHVQPGEQEVKRPSAVIDLFLRSLGEVHGENAIGIVLSGTGRDGALGVPHIKERGGLTIAQAFDDCEHDDMPRAAVETQCVDLVATADEIGRRLVDILTNPRSPTQAVQGPPLAAPANTGSNASDPSERALHDILIALRMRTRHDFRNYKRATVLRRIQRRIQVLNLDDLPGYRDYVTANPSELTPLLADMLISVTSFFRDPEAYEALERDVIPRLLDNVEGEQGVRIWVAGCASGEESYSIAILLREHADRMRSAPPIQIFASDINDAALNFGRAGSYPLNVATDITAARLLAYFEEEGGHHYKVRENLREMLVFAKHNVLSDPPFSGLDLICCRNLLIYLDRTAQTIVFDMFAYALKPGGYLFLGNAESVEASTTLFETISKEHRIYQLRPEAAQRARARIPSQLFDALALPAEVEVKQKASPGIESAPRPDFSMARLHEQTIISAAAPSILIDAEHDIKRVSPGAGRFLAYGEGEPSRNLLHNVAPDIRVDLRSALFNAAQTRQPVKTVIRRPLGDAGSQQSGLILSIYPAPMTEGECTHWLIVFEEPLFSVISAVTSPVDGDEEASAYKQAMMRLEAEIRSLKSHLQDTLDRSAISTEELKASNEELQAINEELRSAKEELETSKEELRSANEELTTVNVELRAKVDEANQNNDDLVNLMEASDIATVFVDAGICVKRFTPRASRLFALIPSDIGRPLTDVKSRLLYEEIVDDAMAAFRHLQPIERSVTSIDDEHYLARIQPYRTRQDKIGGAVLTFIDVTELRRAESKVRSAEARLRDAIASSEDFAVITMNSEGVITLWNDGAAKMFGYKPNEVLGRMIDVLYTEDDRAKGLPEQERRIASRDGRAVDERWHRRQDGTTFFCSGIVTPLTADGQHGFVKIARDMSMAKRQESQQDANLVNERNTLAEVKADSALKNRFLAVVSHELKQPLNLINVNAQLLVRLPETRDSVAVQRIGSTIMKAVSAQDTIVSDLLDLSRVQTGKLRLQRQTVNIATIVQQLAVAFFNDAQAKGIALEVDTSAPAICDCDPVRIEQIVWNLLGNALKFTPAGGKVSLIVSVEGQTAKIAVTDAGIGISAEYLPEIFALFSQSDDAGVVPRRRAGLGIGLALVKELVEAHAGHVEASSPGKGLGATFTVRLPLAGTRAGGADSSASTEPFEHRLLLMDDDRNSLSAFADLLRIEGAFVDVAAGPDEALAMLTAETYDAMLTHIDTPEMPHSDWIQAAKKLQPESRLFAIACTSFAHHIAGEQFRAAGYDACLQEPLSINLLRAALEAR